MDFVSQLVQAFNEVDFVVILPKTGRWGQGVKHLEEVQQQEPLYMSNMMDNTAAQITFWYEATKNTQHWLKVLHGSRECLHETHAVESHAHFDSQVSPLQWSLKNPVEFRDDASPDLLLIVSSLGELQSPLLTSQRADFQKHQCLNAD